MTKRTTIEIDQAGNFQIDQQGFTGTACAETTKKLMAGIAHSAATNEDKKPEYHNRAATTERATQRW